MKSKYEISIWEDVLSEDGNSFQEKKIITIGSDTMTSGFINTLLMKGRLRFYGKINGMIY